jgi:hypothetical protein
MAHCFSGWNILVVAGSEDKKLDAPWAPVSGSVEVRVFS